MLDNNFLNQWVDQKSSYIISKLEKEPLNSEEMLILVLKAQINHFEHLDQDLRKDIASFKTEVITRFDQINKGFEYIYKRFEHVDKSFDQVDKRFERVYSFMKWQLGIIAGLFSGLYAYIIISHLK